MKSVEESTQQIDQDIGPKIHLNVWSLLNQQQKRLVECSCVQFISKQLPLHFRARRTCYTQLATRIEMRYKRVNILALDASSMPTCPENSSIKKIIESLKLDPTKLKSVQIFHSTRIIYVGLQDGESAVDIAIETTKRNLKINGSMYPVKITLADEDIVDVRIQHVPPETPNPIIEETLRKYGKVLSLKSEQWVEFFPGALTGVRIARMLPSQNIPSFLSIGNSRALVTYSGQIQTCRRCNLPVHQNRCKPQKEPPQAANGGIAEPQNQRNETPHQQPHQEPHAIDSSAGASLAKDNDNAETMEQQDNDGFITVRKKRQRRNAIDKRIDDNSESESEKEPLMGDAELIQLTITEARQTGKANYQRFLVLRGAPSTT